MSQIASPFSTGGGGVYFESCVQAAFIATMLAGGVFPWLPPGKVDFIRLQARQLGYLTDDIFVKIHTDDVVEHKLLVLIKHSVRFTQSDREFSDVINAFWHDFSDNTLFNESTDRLLLITGPLSKDDIQHIGQVLDWARGCQNGTEFINKVNTSHFSSERKRAFIRTMETLLERAKQSRISNNEIWRFCRVFFIQGYDYDRFGSKDLASVLTMLQMAKAYSVNEPEDTFWARLILYTQQCNQNAATISIDNIPAELANWFDSNRPLANNDAVIRLKEHSQIIMNNIFDTVGPGIAIERNELEQDLRDSLQTSNIVMVIGFAGTGKSALIKRAFGDGSYTLLAMKAEEFNKSHVDQVLKDIQLSDTWSRLSSRFALISNKILLVDGIERLFEASYKSAFRQFIQMISDDPDWKVVITCRLQAAELVKQEFFFPFGIIPEYIEVPGFSPEEVETVTAKIPQLQSLTSSPSLKRLLRNPFLLELACRMVWEDIPEISLLNEDSFRRKVWTDIIEKQSEKERGLPLKRRNAFINICVRRAKAMALGVDAPDCDEEAVQKLVDDGIVAQNNRGFFPAHDVYEDWALLEFIQENYLRHNTNLLMFFNDLGFEPAMRRAYRFWLYKRLESDYSSEIRMFIHAVVQERPVLQFWTDETITAILLSSSVEAYLQNLEKELLEQNAMLLSRTIHILQTACKKPDEMMINRIAFNENERRLMSTVFLEPTGEGWRAVIKFVHNHLEVIGNGVAYSAILGILEEWYRKHRSEDDIDEETRKAGLTALYILEQIKDGYNEAIIQRSIRVMLNFTRAIKAEVIDFITKELFEPSASSRNFCHVLVENCLNFIWSDQLCCYHPELVIKIAWKYWGENSSYRNNSWSSGIAPKFGINNYWDGKCFPTSGIQGPFFALLKYHPQIALDFTLKLINCSVEQYVQSCLNGRLRPEHVDKVLVKLNDGSIREQWSSDRLWKLYRGTSVGPHVIQSSLMALENWILQQIKQEESIGDQFDYLLKNSNNVAITAVLASVAVAYPQIIGERILPILRCPAFFRLDASRMLHESTYPSEVRALLGAPSHGLDEFYENERMKSNRLEHRHKDLENLVLNLQLTSLRKEIWAIIDEFRSMLPAQDGQSEEERLWRLLYQRIDLREYSIRTDDTDRQIALEITDVDSDIKEMSAYAAERYNKTLEKSSLLFWAMSYFKGEAQYNDKYPSWKDIYEIAKLLKQETEGIERDETELSYPGIPVFIAAIGLKDHWDEMEPEQADWCKNIILDAIERSIFFLPGNGIDYVSEMEGIQAAASVLPLLNGLIPENELREVIFACLINECFALRQGIVSGINNYLWKTDSEYAHKCIEGLIAFSKLEQDLIPEYQGMYGTDADEHKNEIIKTVINLCEAVADMTADLEIELGELNFQTYYVREIITALALIPPDSEYPIYNKLYQAVLKEMIYSCTREARIKQQDEQISYERKLEFCRLFAYRLLKQPIAISLDLCQPLMEAIVTAPQIVSLIMTELICAEDALNSQNTFWVIWKSLYDSIKNKHVKVRGKYSRDERSILRNILLMDIPWKKETKDWGKLNQQTHFIKKTICELGYLPPVFEAAVEFFNSIGSQFMPAGMLWLSEAINRGVPEEIMGTVNVQFYLESLLRNNIMTYESEIRGNGYLRNAVMKLLGILIDAGSASAFQLRERIVTPLPSEMIISQ